MAIRSDASTDRLTGGGITGTVGTITCWFRVAVDRNNFSNVWVLWNSGTTGVEAGFGTLSDGVSFTTFDSAFTTQTGPTVQVGAWYCMALVMNGTSWTLYYGTSPSSLTVVGPDTMAAISSPGGLSISDPTDWLNGDVASFKAWARALSAAEVAAELSTYQVVDATSLVRVHSFFQSPGTTNEAGSGDNLTAGNTTTTTSSVLLAIDGDVTPPLMFAPGLWQSPSGQFPQPWVGSEEVPSSGTNVAAEEAPFTVAANDATTTVSTNAEEAPFTVAAQDGQVSVFVNADVATFSVVANDTTSTIAANAEGVSFSVAANDTTSTVVANAETATLSVDAQDPAASVGVAPSSADFTFDAQDATVSTSGATNANAESAAFTVTAHDAQVSVGVNAAEAAVTVAAENPTTTIVVNPAEAALSVAADNAAASVFVNAQVATFSVAAEDMSTTISPVVDVASFLFEANDPSVLTGTVINAEVASFSIAAFDLTATVAPEVQFASFSIDAFAAEIPQPVAVGTMSNPTAMVKTAMTGGQSALTSMSGNQASSQSMSGQEGLAATMSGSSQTGVVGMGPG